ncbi:hypothetical protein [Roseovarius sp. E0-M6]|uniref:hypothetical protein n=1 Tax=Roseovarius sp. E0-M6 TaxID=3127118 RepID=UPI00301017C1
MHLRGIRSRRTVEDRRQRGDVEAATTAMHQTEGDHLHRSARHVPGFDMFRTKTL